jgi:hypothetical protein
VWVVAWTGLVVVVVVRTAPRSPRPYIGGA